MSVARVDTRGNLVLAATILGSSMAFIDGTVVNVALPVLQREFGADVSGLQWVVEAYSVLLAALILVGGALGDHLGRRRVFGVGVVLFTASSIACGLAPSLPVLIGARAIQGIGGAMLTPQSLAIISACFEGERRGKAIGTWSGFSSLTAAAGPVIGGWLIQVASWRLAFLLNVPMALAVLALLRYVPESRDPSAGKGLDWAGAVLATAGLAGIVYGFVFASTSGFGQLPVQVALAAGGVFLVSFVWAESKVSSPMMPLGLFGSREFSGTQLFTLLLYAALGGALFFLPFNLIQVQGYPPQAAGASLLPFVLLMFGLSRWAGGLVSRYGARPPLVIGPLIVAAGFVMFARPAVGGSYWTTFFPAVTLLGLGMSTAVAPLSTTVMSSVDSAHSGLASGINNAVARTAGVLAIAILSLFVVAAFGRSLDGRLRSARATPAAIQAIEAQQGKLASIDLPSGVSNPDQIKAQIDLAFVDGFRVAMFISAGLALGASACAALTIRAKTTPPQ